MLKKLLGKNKEEKTPKNGISMGLKQTIMGVLGARGIPSMPSSAQKAFKLTIDPNASAKDFVEVIESDEALSGRVVRVANSVYFDRGNPAQGIEESVNVIGLNELRCLLNANSLPELLPSKHPARAQIWANDIATAIIARNIAASVQPNKESSAFLAGLMHDVGKLLMLQRLEDDYEKVLKRIQQEGGSFCPIEEDIFAFNHCEVGQLIAEKWNFTEELTDVIRDHHEPWQDDEVNGNAPTLVTIVKAADTLSHALGIGHEPGFHKLKSRYEEDLEKALAALNVRPDEKREYLERQKKNFELEADLYMSN